MSDPLPTRLHPPKTKPITSAVFIPDAWYIACTSAELGYKPVARTLLGRPLALYRDGQGKPAALLDRCPHRNVPLSGGAVVSGHLECPYHGWQFDCSGTCKRIPGLIGDPAGKARRAEAHVCMEQDGFIWLWGRADTEPPAHSAPPRFPHLDDPKYAVVRDQFQAQGSLHAVAENALDVPHTAFLHGGLFRNDGERRTIDVVVKRWPHAVEAQYIGEARPEGLVGRILAPKGGEVTHYDRFFLPNRTQVEYRLSERSHIVVTSVLTPVRDFETRLYAVITFKLPLPTWLVKLVAKPIGRRIFAQDERILAQQTQLIERFGGERFASTELDVLGQHIRSLLRAAERGDPHTTQGPTDEPSETQRIQMQV
jgi:phenylpropionate dioxygenase-like ring-hydroxylating dioxygenase large terminal subunit